MAFTGYDDLDTSGTTGSSRYWRIVTRVSNFASNVGEFAREAAKAVARVFRPAPRKRWGAMLAKHLPTEKPWQPWRCVAPPLARARSALPARFSFYQGAF